MTDVSQGTLVLRPEGAESCCRCINIAHRGARRHIALGPARQLRPGADACPAPVLPAVCWPPAILRGGFAVPGMSGPRDCFSNVTDLDVTGFCSRERGEGAVSYSDWFRRLTSQ